MKKPLLIGLKILITGFIVWYVIKRLDEKGGLPAIIEHVRNSDPVDLVLALALFLCVLGVAVWRWQILLRVQGIRLSNYRTFWITAVGMFFNAFLPGGTGGDVLKAVYISVAAPQQKARAVITVVVDRLIGLMGLFVLASVCVIIYFQVLWANSLTRAIPIVVLGSMTFAVVVICLSTQRQWVASQSWWPKIWKKLPAKETLLRISESFELYRKHPRPLFLALCLSVTVHTLGVLAAWSIGNALDITGVHVGHYLLYCPLINAISAIPITVGGLGLREMWYQNFFGLQGVDASKAAALGFLYYVVSTPLLSLICGGFYLLGKPKDPISSAIPPSE